MTQRFQGLHQNSQTASEELADGLYLVRVERAQYRWHRLKPFYVIRFLVLEPQKSAMQLITGRLDCAAKSLWKLGWFLGDFAYDADLLKRDEVNEKAMLGLCGVVKVRHLPGNDRGLFHFEGFAPADQWPGLASRAFASRVLSREATQ